MAKFKVAASSEYTASDSAGTARAMTSYIDTIEPLGKVVMPLDVTAFSDAAERIIAGIEASQEWAISGHYDDAATGPRIFGTAVGVIGTFAWSPAGTGATARKITGSALCMSYITRGEVKGRVEWEARFKLDGTITVGTT